MFVLLSMICGLNIFVYSKKIFEKSEIFEMKTCAHRQTILICTIWPRQDAVLLLTLLNEYSVVGAWFDRYQPYHNSAALTSFVRTKCRHDRV